MRGKGEGAAPHFLRNIAFFHRISSRRSRHYSHSLQVAYERRETKSQHKSRLDNGCNNTVTTQNDSERIVT